MYNNKWTPERIDGDAENKMEWQSLLQEATEDKTWDSKLLQTYMWIADYYLQVL